MRLSVAPAAVRDLAGVPREVAVRVAAAIERLAGDPRPRGCLLLRDSHPPTWRIRVGDWRILYEVNDDDGVVMIARVRHRTKAYR